MDTLTEGALQSIMNGDNVLEPVLQVLSTKKINTCTCHNKRYQFLLSDGKFKVSIFTIIISLLSQTSILALELYAIIKLKRYLTKKDNDKRVLLILDLEVIAEGWTIGKMLGNPLLLMGASHSYDVPKKSRATGRDFFLQTRPISPISSLHPLYKNWLIRAKVLNKTCTADYSRSKGVRVLCTIELGDHSGKISCSASGRLVDKFLDFIEVDKVYYVSKGVVRPICPEPSPLKKFEIILTPQSQFEEAQNDGDNPAILVKNPKFHRSRISKSTMMFSRSQSKLNPHIRWMTFKDVHKLERSRLENGVLFQTFGTILQVRVEKKIAEKEKCGTCHEDIQNFRIKMNISDLSCDQWVTGFPLELEKILGRTVYEIGKSMDRESAAVVLEGARFKQFTFTCMAKLEDHNSEQQLRFVMLNVREPQSEEHTNYLLKKINNINGLMK